MSVTTSLCTVLCCCNLTRKGTKVSMKIKHCTAQRVCETLRARVCVVCTKWKGDGDGAVRVLTRWGPLSCGLFECGGRWGLLDGGAPLVADSSYCCLSGSPLLSLPLRPCLDPFSWMLDSLRLRPSPRRAAMPILHFARDRVTCAARARQRGTVGFAGWRAAVGRGHGNVASCERGFERVWVARCGRAGAWE